jgi:putative PEP-CTERM system histidine kinase
MLLTVLGVLPFAADWTPAYAVLVLLALAGLVLVEQLFRNLRRERQWQLKHLVLALGGLFAYDVYLFAHALLFGALDPVLWDARALVTILAVPLIALAAARNRDWSPRLFVSRQVVFYTSSLAGAGLVLMLMAAGGYYVRLQGGSWGEFAQVALLVAALFVVGALALSASLRARLRVFLGKHFYSNKYDYRKEWLAFTRHLTDAGAGPGLPLAVVRGLGEMMESRGGLIWLRGADDRYACRAAWNVSTPAAADEDNAGLALFLEERDWVIDLDERRAQPRGYGDWLPPRWLSAVPEAWLIVPLRLSDRLQGFVVLQRSIAPRVTDWEDWDLLRTAGAAAASHLALAQASEALAEARQFEAFNRLSAYVVHDLKNVAGQLSLVVSNAGRHRDNKAFLQDAIDTVEHAVAKMNRILGQLRKGRFVSSASVELALDEAVEEVARHRSTRAPAPRVDIAPGDYRMVGDRDRLVAVIEHLVENAQQATAPEGFVLLRLRAGDEALELEVIDDGCGMDADFLRERLFRPFDTTKGNAGMGIGAYESREVARAHGGELLAESTPGQGSRLRLILPRVFAPRSAPAADTESNQPSTPPSAALQGRT